MRLCSCSRYTADTVLKLSPRLEIFNSKFTSNFGEWALGFCGGIYGKDNPGCMEQVNGSLQNVTTLDLSDRCIHNLISKVRWISV